jgi:predicted restriction endonuclease
MGPDPKPSKRIKATHKDWQVLRWHKMTQGCRLCGMRDRVELHHLVGRDLGGDDVLDNLVPLCPTHHQMVEERVSEACYALREQLRASEIRYVLEKKSFVFLNRYYPLGGDE